MEKSTDYSRYFDWNEGRDFVARLLLEDWDVRSVWGLDNGAQTFFAGLWRNHQFTPVPNHTLFTGDKYYRCPGCIAADIADITSYDPLTVVRAMAIADPAPTARRGDEIARELAELHSRSGSPTFIDGVRDGLLWAQGSREITPGSRIEWPGGTPTPEEVDAEEQMLVGRMYDYELIDDQAFHAGADSALMWVLGRREAPFPGAAKFVA
jgi:hypothetical protein